MVYCHCPSVRTRSTGLKNALVAQLPSFDGETFPDSKVRKCFPKPESRQTLDIEGSPKPSMSYSLPRQGLHYFYVQLVCLPRLFGLLRAFRAAVFTESVLASVLGIFVVRYATIV